MVFRSIICCCSFVHWRKRVRERDSDDVATLHYYLLQKSNVVVHCVIKLRYVTTDIIF